MLSNKWKFFSLPTLNFWIRFCTFWYHSLGQNAHFSLVGEAYFVFLSENRKMRLIWGEQQKDHKSAQHHSPALRLLNPLTYWADSARWSSDAGGHGAVLHGAGLAQLGGGSSSGNLWGSWGGVGWLALGCLRLGRQVQWLCTLTALQKPKQHSFACCDHRRDLEAGGGGGNPSHLPNQR